jgi:iron complex outermembrane receptor protein
LLNDGTLQREKLFSKELGYYFAPENTAFSGDIRLFQEQITDGIGHTENRPTDSYLNIANNDISGIEWQLKWQPSAATRVLFSQTWTDIRVNSAPSNNSSFRMEHGAPRYASSLALMHQFDRGWNLSLMQQVSDDLALMSTSDRRWLFSMKRTDLRLAKEFRLGGAKAELSVTAQNLGDPYEDGDHKFLFNRRTLVTLKIEN